MSRARLRVPASTAGPIAAGHPWVFREGAGAPAGTWVEIVGPGDRALAWGLADDGPIAARVLGLGALPADPLAVVARGITASDAARPRFLPPDTDAWRAVNGEGDGLPGLVVDRYGDLAIIRLYAAGWVPHLPAIAAAVAALPGIADVARRLGVARVDAGDGLVPLLGSAPPAVRVVREAGVALLVRPYVGQKTGLFLDQREHRMLVRRWAGTGVAANLFSYNGGFSVAAALGGARRVFTVDIAPAAIDDARETFRLNGLDPAAHAFEVADAFAWEPPSALDLLVVDPPSLAHAKAGESAARAAYQALHRRLGPVVAPGGLLATSSCTARLGAEVWKGAVRAGLGPGWSWCWSSAEAPDHPVSTGHPEGSYLKFAVLRRRG
jgi:23S rRNA (cytosine1962-C5)-methyltransferase